MAGNQLFPPGSGAIDLIEHTAEGVAVGEQEGVWPARGGLEHGLQIHQHDRVDIDVDEVGQRTPERRELA